jgi:hypothetical protein
MKEGGWVAKEIGSLIHRAIAYSSAVSLADTVKGIHYGFASVE